MIRAATYLVLLALFSGVPATLFFEYSNNYSWLSGFIVRGIVFISELVLADATVLSEITPAAAAVFLAALAPRPMRRELSIFSISICFVGYFMFALLQVHIGGGTVFFDRSMQPWIESFIDGYVASADFDRSVGALSDFCRSLRIFYMMVGASVLGFMMNPTGRG